MIALICLARSADLEAATAWPELDEGCCALALPLGDGIAAVAARVPEDMFTGEAAQQRLADAEWLRDRALAHEAIVRAASGCGPVLPLAFGTVFHDEASLRARIAPVAGAVDSFLTRIEPYDEYAVKAFADVERAAELVAESQSLSETPGQAYLRRAKMRRQGDQEVEQWLEAKARWIAGELADVCDDLIERRASHATDRAQRMILNAALLIERSRADELPGIIEKIAGQADGIDLELSGPWPLYSFAPTLDGSGAMSSSAERDCRLDASENSDQRTVA